MRRSIIILGFCAVAAAGSGALWHSRRADAVAKPISGPPRIPIVEESVQVSDIPIVLRGIGSVQPYNTVDVRAQVAGTIQRIGFVEGQTVRKGDLIAQLDPRPFQAVLNQAEANLARDAANLANARVNLNRYTPLMARGFASTQQVTDQQSQVAQLAASVAADKAAIFNAQTQLSYATITSPIDGVTGIRQVDIGNILQPTTATPIGTITQIQPISVVFTLPQTDIPDIQAAMAKGTLTTVAYDQNDRMLEAGTLLLVNNAISQSSGTARLKATFPNGDKKLWPGEFVNISLELSHQPNALSIPLASVQQGQSGTFVFVVSADGTVTMRSVTIGETLDGRAVIDRGLQPGDVVVTAGQYLLSDGVKTVSVHPDDPRVQNSSEASAGML
jgi:membrane fusion protein, multidrug efflux system